MNDVRYKMRYRRGDATADEIRAVADDLIRELADPTSEAGAEAMAAGIDPASVRGAVTVEVEETAQGAEPFLTAVLVGITVSAGSQIAESIWKDLLWPRIKRRLGAGALGPRVSDGR